MRLFLLMSRAGLGAILLSAAFAGSSAEAAAPAACSVFKSSFLKATSDLKSQFVRPLTVTRKGEVKDDVYDFISEVHADVVLTCRGEKFERFEANLNVPADPSVLAGFARIQLAALTSAFNWTSAHAQSAMRTINSEAAEYLKASIQRGDVVLAGKTEYHEGGGGGLGMMYTPNRRTFVVVNEN